MSEKPKYGKISIFDGEHTFFSEEKVNFPDFP